MSVILPVLAFGRPAPWELGTLTCSLAKGLSAAPGEPGLGRDVVCLFRPGDRGAEETYIGTVQFVGRDGAFPGGGTLMMVVKAVGSMKLAAGLLEQRFGAEATGYDKQPALIGQTDTAIALHSAASVEPSLALGQPLPAVIITLELKLRSSPA